jgi:formylglycine-generating enzyme required for sulfatase activity
LLSVDYSNAVFSQIRSTYFAGRINHAEYWRLTYVLSGVAEREDLIKDSTESPFNIGERITLGDFTRSEFELLVEKARIDLSNNVKNDVYEWTAGDPRMTWDVCSALEDIALSGHQVVERDVSRVVDQLYLMRLDRPPIDRIRALAEDNPEVRGAITSLRRGKGHTLNIRTKGRLYLAGIIGSVGGPPTIKNRIVEAALSDAWLAQAAEALDRYRESRIAKWSEDRYGVRDRLFTRLSLLLDRGQDADERWIRQKEQYESLAEVLEAYPNYPAFVILGDPGAGKSTLLRRMDLDIAREDRNPGSAKKFSYIVSLRDYRRPLSGGLPPDPLGWLRNKWADDWKTKHPELPDLDDLLRSTSYLLLDALNEMPVGTPADYRLFVELWMAFIASAKAHFPECRMVFSCRSLDYSASLSSRGVQVPHLEIERLDAVRIQKFLEHYAPDNAEALFDAIETSGQLGLYGTAYYLKMLCDHAKRTDHVPQDRAALFTAFVRELSHREINKGTGPLATAGLLEDVDLTLLGMANPPWRSPYELPEKGPLFKQLASLAFNMQAINGTAGSSRQLFIAYDDVLQRIAPALRPARPEELIDTACALSLLEHDRPRGRVQFIHQLMQEYFAARHLAVAPEPDLAQAPWRKADVKPSVEEAISGRNINEPLPMLDSTGWEETMLLAATMAADRSAFLEGLIDSDSNLPLAGRAAAQIQVSEAQHDALPGALAASKLSPELVARIQSLLLERMVHPEADLRCRIAAGKALGELGDPRFRGKKNARGRYEYLFPPTIHVPGGTYQIGTDETDEKVHPHERPRHPVKLRDFRLAQFPVTNAEWDCFMKAGGYDDERWWATKAAKQWRVGETTRAARDAQWRAFREMLKRNLDYIERKLLSQELSPKAATEHYKARDSSDAAFEASLKRDFEESLRKGDASSRYTEPRRWRNKDFNNPLQPVVGICWFEAQAYCAWLSSQTGQIWRLPTEAEWEAAARLEGPDDARYPWGPDFERTYCDTFESHIRAPTPVGIFPDGDAAVGLVDISGNAYEWTSSKYDKLKYPYPYEKNDGRESPEDVGDASNYEPRVLRGGSWYYSKDEARITFRLRFHPGYHNQSTGLRLALDA